MILEKQAEERPMYAIRSELLETLRELDPQSQERVLDFARSIQRPVGEPVAEIIRHAREINFPQADLEEIARLIDEDFEQVIGDELDVPDLDR
jgi:hypothetical protein